MSRLAEPASQPRLQPAATNVHENLPKSACMNGKITTPRVVLLGPQRLAPIVDQGLDLLQVSGTVAVINPGWQEREDEDGELKAALGRSAINLMLHARGEIIYRDDPAL